jgi:hypothetical protein
MQIAKCKMKNLRDRGQGFEGSRGQDRKHKVLGSDLNIESITDPFAPLALTPALSEAMNAYLWHVAISQWLKATGNASRVLGEGE